MSPRRRFEIPYETAKFVNVLEEWTLKSSQSCEGESACNVSVVPSFGEEATNSSVLITARATCTALYGQQLYLCPQRQSFVAHGGASFSEGNCVAPSSVPTQLKEVRNSDDFDDSAEDIQALSKVERIFSKLTRNPFHLA